MTSDAYVNHIPTMTGGYGFEELRRFTTITLFHGCRRIRESCRSRARLVLTGGG